ncbi:MAG: ATPase, T2SS/T4P/T4SS family [Clostridia bacterium]
MAKAREKLGNILLAAGKITELELNQAVKIQNETHQQLGDVLKIMGAVSENEIIDVLAEQLGVERVFLTKIYIDPIIAQSIPREIAKKYSLIPIYEKNGQLVVAMSNPMNINALDDVRFISQKKIIPVITDSTSIEQAIEVYYSKQTTDKAIEDLKREYSERTGDRIDQSVIDEIQNAPAVRLTNAIITQAITIRASDIHIEPFDSEILVRYRIDGVLVEGPKIPPNLYSAVSTRIKIMSGMNIAEKRIPLDGRIEMEQSGKIYDFRVSSLPTVFGEKIVIRILDRSKALFNRTSIGFSEEENHLIDKLVKVPHGIILLTGPTGSGKTTTLYTFLSELNQPDRNIVTVEDPVEYMMHGVNQVQVNQKAGMTFAVGLRSILRQDPDIIMVGEIRDEETAQIAVRAAITGHLVLSTLHTNDAPGAVTRLVDMGVQPYLAADAMVAVIAQRLVRKLCTACKEAYQAEEVDLKMLKMENSVTLYRAVGCPLCGNTGYAGRTAIHEILMLDNEMRSLIENGGNAEQLRNLALAKGMVNLYENCKSILLKGVTSMYEMVKTVYARD